MSQTMRELLSQIGSGDRGHVTLGLAKGMAMAAADPVRLGEALAESEFSEGEITYLAVVVGGAIQKIKEANDRRGASPPTQPVDVEGWLDAKVRSQLGDDVRRIARGKTYESSAGKRFHVRTMVPHPRGAGESSCFYGLADDKWNDGDVFVLAFGTEAVLVVPVVDWLGFKGKTPSSVDPASGVTIFKPTLWKTTSGRIELRVGGDHVDASRWLDNWDELR